jgi:hypothetical protein
MIAVTALRLVVVAAAAVMQTQVLGRLRLTLTLSCK